VCCMLYSHINYCYIMGDQRMMSFGFSGSPPPFWQIKYDDDDDRFVASLFSYTTLRASVYDNTLSQVKSSQVK